MSRIKIIIVIVSGLIINLNAKAQFWQTISIQKYSDTSKITLLKKVWYSDYKLNGDKIKFYKTQIGIALDGTIYPFETALYCSDNFEGWGTPTMINFESSAYIFGLSLDEGYKMQGVIFEVDLNTFKVITYLMLNGTNSGWYGYFEIDNRDRVVLNHFDYNGYYSSKSIKKGKYWETKTLDKTTSNVAQKSFLRETENKEFSLEELTNKRNRESRVVNKILDIREESNENEMIDKLIPQDGFTIWKNISAKMAYLVYPNGDYRKINPFNWPWYASDAETTFQLISELLKAPIETKKFIFKSNAVYIGEDLVFEYGNRSNLNHTRIVKNEKIEFQCTKIPSAYSLRIKEGKFNDLGNGKAKIEWNQNDSKYDGEVLNGNPNGYGEYNGHISNFNYINANSKTIQYFGYWKNGRFNGSGKLITKQLVATNRKLFDVLMGEEIWVECSGDFVEGAMDGKIYVKNAHSNSPNYRAELNYSNGKFLNGEIITDEYYEERIANESKRHQQNIARRESAMATGKYYIIEKKNVSIEKYSCNGISYSYKVYPVNCNCMTTKQYNIYYWNGECGYKAGFYNSISFDTDDYLGATEKELEIELKSKCGCN